MPDPSVEKSPDKKPITPERPTTGVGLGTAVVAGAAAGVLSAAVVGLLSKHGQSATLVSQRLMELLRQIKEYHDWGIFTVFEYNQMRSIILSKMVSSDSRQARGRPQAGRQDANGGEVVNAVDVTASDLDSDIMEAVDVDGNDAGDAEIMDAANLEDGVTDGDTVDAAEPDDDVDDGEIIDAAEADDDVSPDEDVMDAADLEGDVDDDDLIDANDADEVEGDELDEAVDDVMDDDTAANDQMDDQLNDEPLANDDGTTGLFDADTDTDNSYLFDVDED